MTAKEIKSMYVPWMESFGLPKTIDSIITVIDELETRIEKLESTLEERERYAVAQYKLELLQTFNDYEVPLTMTAEQVREIIHPTK